MTAIVTVPSAAGRELYTVELMPVQGRRFQPTGFPDLGAATYQLADNTPCLLVESAQSTANRLEYVCWDEAQQDLVPELAGLPYLRVEVDSVFLTSSILEAHRVNSPYILEASRDEVFNDLRKALGTDEAGPVDISKLARWCFRHDPNSVLHGLFLAKKEIAGGRYRMKRVLSGFIEATNIRMVNSGGVKNDRINPSGETREGYGNVPYQRQEFTAEHVTAYFNIDLTTLQSYRLGEHQPEHDRLARHFLLTLAHWKIRRFLETGLRLRTACDLVVHPEADVNLPSLADLTQGLRRTIEDCTEAGLFAAPPVRRLAHDKIVAKKREATR